MSSTPTLKSPTNAYLAGEAYRNFHESIRAPDTRRVYTNSLCQFMTFVKVDSFEKLLAADNKLIEARIISFIVSQRERKLSTSVIHVRLAALKHFYSMNDVTLNWKKIAKYIGERTRVQKDRPYKIDEIKRILERSDLRMKVVVLLLASTGMRIGALPDLELRHLTKVTEHNLYEITVYEGTNDEYLTYCTPEAANVIDLWLDGRKRCGENLKPDTPLLRNLFDRNDLLQVNNPKRIDKSNVRTQLCNILLGAGVRQRIPLTEKTAASGGRIRHEVKIAHGFRKFYDTVTTQAGVHPLYVEMLVGHRIGLKGSYFRPSPKDLLEGNDKTLGYVAAIDALTISDEQRLRGKVSQLSGKVNDVEHTKRQLEEKYQQDLKAMRDELKQEILHKDTRKRALIAKIMLRQISALESRIAQLEGKPISPILTEKEAEDQVEEIYDEYERHGLQ